MSDKNVKLKTSSVAPISESKDTAVDSFNKSSAKKQKIGPGGSKYAPESQKTEKWKLTKFGGNPKNTALPGIPETDGVLSSLANLCSEFNTSSNSMMPYQRTFIPRNKFDAYRTVYEWPDNTKQFDLDANLPVVPSFGNIYGQIRDADYAQQFFSRKISAINSLIENTKYELENQRDPDVIRARKNFYKKLLKTKTYAEKQLAQAVASKKNETISE